MLFVTKTPKLFSDLRSLKRYFLLSQHSKRGIWQKSEYILSLKGYSRNAYTHTHSDKRTEGTINPFNWWLSKKKNEENLLKHFLTISSSLSFLALDVKMLLKDVCQRIDGCIIISRNDYSNISAVMRMVSFQDNNNNIFFFLPCCRLLLCKYCECHCTLIPPVKWNSGKIFRLELEMNGAFVIREKWIFAHIPALVFLLKRLYQILQEPN